MQSLILFLTLPFFLLNIFSNKHVIVLLQNNNEIRPSGGFMGSYADIVTKARGIKSWSVEDIYVPDGQIKGHVEPPAPLQEAFKTGEYRLRDSNWKVSFPEAGSEINWFFEKGGIKNIDSIVALNLGLFEKMLDIIGPVKPIDYDESVTSDNFSMLAENYAQSDFFPGSIQKKNYLSAFAKEFYSKLIKSSISDKIKIYKLLIDQLKNRQIFIWFKDPNIEAKISQKGWDGSLGDYNVDYFYSVESNLGSNKANRFVTRKIVHVYKDNGDNYEVSVKIDWSNKPNNNDNYLNYERIVIPKEALSVKVNFNGESIDYDDEDDGKFKIIGFWVEVPANTDRQLTVSYSLGKKEGVKYNLVTKTQPGIYD